MPSGALIGFVSAMCGVGGGLFAVPLLHFGHKLELRRAVATSLALVLATVSAGTLSEVLRADSAIDWGLLGFLVAGALLGSQAGFRVAQKLDVRIVRAVFVVVLAVAGARMLSGPEGAGDGGDGLAGLALYAAATAIGFAGGFVSPLLGIGGGLILVPALYLVLPEQGFAGARAMSLATSIASAARSLVLYARLGEVVRPSAECLAAGAAAGAVLGVQVVHLQGAVDLARTSLGLLLLYVSARFVVQLARERRRVPRV